MDRLTLEQINNMTESQMREYLRGLEVENQRKDMDEQIAAQEEQNKREQALKDMDDFFKHKFENGQPKIGDQW